MSVTVRAPFRVSLFGGGTDLPAWSKEHGGQVLSTTIDKFCWISVRHLPPFFPSHVHRIVWSRVEEVDSIDAIQHPAVKAVLKFLEWPETQGLEIHHQGDLPARSGMGSSSAFTVALLQALHALRGRLTSKEQLAREAIYVEQNILKETVGAQDQVAAAYGGLNVIRFRSNDGVSSFEVQPVPLSAECITALEKRLHLYYVGPRPDGVTGSVVSKTYDLDSKSHHLRMMAAMVDESLSLLARGDLDGVGALLHDAWKAKKELGGVSDARFDAAYDKARHAGALGGKSLGAGQGGCLLVYVPDGAETAVRAALSGSMRVPFRFDRSGAQVVFHHI